MKKPLVLMLALILVFPFAACTPNSPPDVDLVEDIEGTETENTGDAEVDNSWVRIQTRGYFILGLDDDFPPMGYRDANNEIVGFDIDMAMAVANYLGIEVELRPVAWSTVIGSLTEGDIDCIWNGMRVTAELLAQIDITNPYVNSSQIVVVPANSAITGLAGLAGKTVGTQAGSSALTALNTKPEVYNSFARLREYEAFTIAMMELDAGRLDAVVIDAIAFYGEFNLKSPGTYSVLEENFASEEMAVGVRMEDNAWTDKLNEAMSALKADGTAAQISIKWFGEDIVI